MVPPHSLPPITLSPARLTSKLIFAGDGVFARNNHSTETCSSFDFEYIVVFNVTPEKLLLSEHDPKFERR